MKLTAFYWIVFLSMTSLAHGQETEQNIVPNPGFELYSGTPLGWFYTGRDFTRVLKYWESPTAASPDVYGPKVFVPSQWKEQGFGESEPAGGSSMIGVTLYGCGGGKPHCREYVQIRLSEPLVTGQRYAVVYQIKPLLKSMRIKNLGVAFSVDRVHKRLDELVKLIPQVEPSRIAQSPKDSWQVISGEFYASDPAEFMIMGNFYTDEETEFVLSEQSDPLMFAYYYIDDVVVKKLPPIIEIPIEENDLSTVELIAGKTVQLSNIYFDLDHDDFLPRSYRELYSLVEIMKDNAEMRIEIHGHTDNIGADEYNLALSRARASAVANYVIRHGVDASRVFPRGYGSTMPIASNDSEDGRQENRRVEFLILTK
jgi:outer membrane protein OmpA-like peptidoglycan-associated protein